MKNSNEFLTGKLRKRAETLGNQIALGFLEDGHEITQSFTVGALDARINDVASTLKTNVSPDERVLLLFPPGLDFVVAFLGCLRAGRVAVPAIPPEPHKPARSLARLAHLVNDARPAMVLSTTTVLPFRPLLDTSVPMLATLPWIDVTAVPQATQSVDEPTDDGLAFLQYTSGSTAEPKGVRILRRNLTHNLWVIHGVAPEKPAASVSWLPQFHDMGLIEGILLPLDGGWPAWLMPPWAFLSRPLAWLQAIQRFDAMRSGGPNFAYDLCIRKITPEIRHTLDLSCWRQAYCGAEPIRAATLAAFADAFAPARFSAASWFPCYGLAEHTVLATCRTHKPHLVERLSTRHLARGKALMAQEGERTVDVVCVGEIPLEVTARIVDSEGRPLPDGFVGEVYLQSGSVADGYWQDEHATGEVFNARLNTAKTTSEAIGPFLRTGDLGYRRRKQLFIVGRRKDVLIVHGQNHHAHDVERTAEAAHPAIRRGCVCAVMPDAGLAVEIEKRPVVICEVDGIIDRDKRLSVTTAVHRAIMYEQGIAVDVALVPKHTLPKTSSGKLQRRATAQLVREGSIEVPLGESAQNAVIDENEKLDAARLAIRKVSGLDENEIDVNLPPARLALDSLQTVDAVTALERLLGRTILLSEWGDAPSLRALVEGNSSIEAPWRAHVELPLPQFTVRKKHSRSTILVTGGTGLIGRALVTELRRQGRRVLVMARNAGQAGGLAGDVSRSRFGLEEATYPSLLEDVDVVMHVAGAVNWVLPYTSLVPTNVDGTVNVLAFCAESGARLVHVSSQIVCHGTEDGPDKRIDDSEDPRQLRDRLPFLPLGYAQSKAVSEWLVHRARENGLEATIVRPALVPAALDDATPDDIVSILIRTFVEAGVAPDVDWPFPVCPAEHLISVLASMVDHGPPLVHVADESRSTREVIAWLVLTGYDVRLIPWSLWLETMEARGLHKRAPLRNLWPFIASETLLAYAGERRARVHIAPAFRVHEPLDAAFIDERVRAWQKLGWLPAPMRTGVRATLASRALPVAPKRVFVDGARHDVIGAQVHPQLSGGSILSRLATGFCNRPVGIFPATLHLDDGRALDVVLKASAHGDELRALCTNIARVSDPALAKTLTKHGEWLDVGAADTRERALYRFTNGSLARFVPHCHSAFDSFDPDAPLVLERLRVGQQVEQLDAVSDPWPMEQTQRVVESLARMHAAYRERLDKLSEIPWARPLRTSAKNLLPLWEGLFEHARRYVTPDVARVAGALLDNLDWSKALERLPVTLLHNDTNPRNLALRTGDELGIVLYDWELSAMGPATRDLAEWLCFSLSPEVKPEDVFSLVRTHAAVALPGVDDEDLRIAFHASLAWFFFDRLTTYTVVSPIFDLPWLERVFATWLELVEGFAP